MRNIQHILFPVDFSERCRSIKPFVKAFAQKCGAKVTLMHVLQIPASFYNGFEVAYPVSLDLDAMHADAEQKLAAFYGVPAHPVPDGIELTTTSGDAARTIVAYAAANAVDLIMLPTHGYGGFRGLLLGSTTAKVLHDSDCPVWTAAHSEDPHLLDHATFESILCAVDFGPESQALLRNSIEFAAKFRSKLRIVHAVPGAQHSLNVVPDYDFQQFLLTAAREKASELQRQAGTGLEVCIAGGEVSKVVSAAAVHHKADLVILGRGKLHRAFGRLRTHAYAIIRDSPCPILSL